MDWAQILVIILSIFLAIFLLLAIILVVMLIRVTRQIKAVTSSAQLTVAHIEKAMAGITRFASPLALFQLIKKLISKTKKK